MSASVQRLFANIPVPDGGRRTTDVWLTPPGLLEAVGGWHSFDLDPSAPIVRPWPTARAHFTPDDDGLALPWFGRVWLNPPYGRGIGRWLARMAAHGRGLALIFARTDTEAFFRSVWERCSGLLFLRGRVAFCHADGSASRAGTGSGGAPSVLCAYGPTDLDVLAGCGLDGQLVPLRLPRALLVGWPIGTWREVLTAVLGPTRGPVALADLYRALAAHPKCRRNPNWQAKVRQVLQQGPFRRVGRGQWECAT